MRIANGETRLVFVIRGIRMFIRGIWIVLLPRRLLNTRNHAFIGKLPKADTAQPEIPHVAVLASAAKTASHDSGAKLGLLLGTCDDRGLGHIKQNALKASRYAIKGYN